jgi:hypothetical protein
MGCVSARVRWQGVIPLREDDIRQSKHLSDVLRSLNKKDGDATAEVDAVSVNEARIANMKTRMMEKKVEAA